MKWLCVLTFLTFAGQLASAQGPADREEAPNAGPTISPVLRPLEPPESRVVLLPGAKTQRPRVVKPAVPLGPPAAAPPVHVAPAFVAPPMPDVPVAPPAELAEPPAPSLASAPVPQPPSLPAASEPEPPAPIIATTAAAQPFTRPALSEPPAEPPVIAEPATLVPPPEPAPAAQPEPPAPSPSAPNPAFEPREFQAQSALFLQSRIGQWTLAETRLILGEPARQRPALDDKQVANGTIFAFADPTGRYRELELDFDSETNVLRTVFAYPQGVTWQDIRNLFGLKVTATKANRGRMFYSYQNRHLDVLVSPEGQVISLGLY